MVDLEVNHIKKSFKSKLVLRDITFTAKKGACIGILGGNGCGKTTLLSILAGILKEDEGGFLWQGKNVFEKKGMFSQVVGYVPQGTPLFEELTAKDNLLLWYNRKALHQELDGGVLSLLQINDFLHMPVNRMSGGMKKRLSIGCAVAGKQPVLLLDEPTAALDLECKQQIWDYLTDYQHRGGIILLVTHDVNEIEHCDRCYLMKDGRLENYEFDGDVRRLVRRL